MDFLVLEEHAPSSWQQFVTGRMERSPPELLQRWERVRRLGVDPNGPDRVESIVTETQLNERRRQLERLLAVGSDILEATAAAFSDRDFVLLLADQDGVVVKTFGGGEFESHARRVRLIEGAEWAESVRGTNAIGTALTETRPVVVGGYAHFERVNHNLICYACPIRNPSGEVVAVLDATSYSREIDPLAKLAIHGAAQAVEANWRNAVFYGLGRSREQLREQLQAAELPAFLVVPGGAIVERNDAGAPMLSGQPHTIQQTLGVRWTDVRHAIDAGRDRVELSSDQVDAAGARSVRLEPILDANKLVATLIRIEAPPTTPTRARPASARHVEDAFGPIFGDDPVLDASKSIAARFARSSLPVLLLAETGTGKDLMARAIHQASDRCDGPLMAVNCGALTPSLLESELFGYGPGAFTGASADGREGRIGGADGGTLFLDEVGEMPPSLQALLLRVLEDGTYNRVGELESRHSDIRLVCATCRDLPAMVESGEFRKDLYYRIRGATVTLPPLRERDDIVELAEYLLSNLCEELGLEPRILGTDAVQWMRQYDWPGNVRELKNSLHHALVLSDGSSVLRRAFFPDDTSVERRGAENPTSSIEEAERRALERAQRLADGNISEMARRLGVARTTVYRMLDRHDLR
jgi:transcriptional regulator of acetoin/glycerol metabolism